MKIAAVLTKIGMNIWNINFFKLNPLAFISLIPVSILLIKAHMICLFKEHLGKPDCSVIKEKKCDASYLFVVYLLLNKKH